MYEKKLNADTIFYNGVIYTVDEKFSVLESIAIKDGKFIALGSNREILNNFRSVKKIDLNGKYVYPGFIDPHSHFLQYGLELQNADLSNTTSFEDVIDIIKEHHKNANSSWVLGSGWDQNKWTIRKFPNKKQLDELFPNIPVLLLRTDGHAAIANSKALKLANIMSNTRIEGGYIEQRNSELTGILIDNAINFVKKVIPQPTKQEITNVLKDAEERCLEIGLTTVSEAGIDADIIEHIDYLQKNNQLKLRVYAMLHPNEKNFIKYLYKGKYKTDKLNVCSVKLFADGALGSGGARLIDPYSDDNSNYGLLIKPSEYYNKICQIVYDYNFQVNTHCIGDYANRLILNIYGSILKERNDRRWRIEHAQIVHPDDMNLFGKYSIIPSVQIVHAVSDMYWAENKIGKERMCYAYIYKDLLKQNGWLANSSDFPFENINPLHGFNAAFSRKDMSGNPPNGFKPEQALTREDALRAMTIWAAKANFEDNEKGSIEPGKYADFVIIEDDIMKIPDSELYKTRVIKTHINGFEVYTK